MKHLAVWATLLLAAASVAWFFLGDTLGLGSSGAQTAIDGDDDETLLEGTDDVRLSAKGASPSSPSPERTTASGDPMALGGLVVRGRCVDERRMPVAATVTVRFMGGRVVDATAGSDGRFAVALGETPGATQGQGTVYARTDGGLAALHSFWGTMAPATGAADAQEMSAGVVVLRPGQILSVQVTNAAEPVPNADVASFGSGTWGNRALLFEGRADEHGSLTLPLLPPGRVVVLAGGVAGAGRGQASVHVPVADETKPVVVELTQERVVQVEVVDKQSGDPVVGAVLRVGDPYGTPPPGGVGYLPAPVVAPTDSQGRTAIHGIGTGPQESLQVRVEASGYPHMAAQRAGPWSRFNFGSVKAEQDELRIELERTRSTTFPIAPGDVPAPPDGSTLAVKIAAWGLSTGDPASLATAAVRDGHLVIDGLNPGTVQGTVRAPDGRAATFVAPKGKTEGKPVTFVAAHALTVRLLKADGAPASGRHVTLRSRGNFRPGESVTTNEDGEATFPPATTKVGTVVLLAARPSNWWSGVPLGEVKLEAQKEPVVFTLPDERALTLRVRLDGQAGLPSTYWLRVGGQYVPADAIDEVPERGELHVDAALPDGDKPLPVALSAQGYLQVAVEVARTDLGKPVELALQPSATIIARYTKPTDGRFNLGLQVWDEQTSVWSRASAGRSNSWRPGGAQQEENTRRFEGLKAGRYRVIEWHSRLTSDPVDLALRAPPAEVFLDLSVLTHTEGRVVVPAGYEASRATVQRADASDNAGMLRWTGRARVGKDAAFKMRCVRGEPLRLTVKHPLLVPAPDGGTVSARGGATNVVLRLVAGPEIRFRVAGMDLTQPPAPARARERVPLVVPPPLPPGVRSGGTIVTYRIFAPGAYDTALEQGAASVRDGSLVIGGLTAGRYTLMLERADFAPRLYENLELPQGAAKDLGVIDFSKGSTLTVRLEVAPDKPVPSVLVSAQALDGPSYRRTKRGSEAEVSLGALGAGRFQLLVRRREIGMGRRNVVTLLDTEITLDGSNDLAVGVPINK